MARINTALGPIDPQRLGRTLMHEHVFVLSPEIEKWPVGQGLDACEEWGEEARFAEAVDKLGVSQTQIDQMLVENPRRILTPCEPY